MSNDINYDKEFKALKTLDAGEYEACTFTNCTFADLDLSKIIFTDCTFDNCDLSMSKINNTAFREVHFKNCKLLGLRFDECNQFLLAFRFTGCVLNFASFYKLKLKNAHFTDCKLEEVEFIEADLTKAVFNNCALERAVFDNSILDKVDFRTSFNFSINPEFNSIVKARFSSNGLLGFLDKYDIIVE